MPHVVPFLRLPKNVGSIGNDDDTKVSTKNLFIGRFDFPSNNKILLLFFVQSIRFQTFHSFPTKTFIMSRFHPLLLLLQVSVIISLLCMGKVNGFAVRPLVPATTSRLSSTSHFVKQDSAIEDMLKKSDSKADVGTVDAAYQRKKALTFLVADAFTLGFTVFAMIGVSGGILNALGFGYIVTQDGTLLIDTLEHFRMQLWMDAIPPLTISSPL